MHLSTKNHFLAMPMQHLEDVWEKIKHTQDNVKDACNINNIVAKDG